MNRFLTGFGAAVLVAGAAWFFAGGAPSGAQEKDKAGPPRGVAQWEYTLSYPRPGKSSDVEEFTRLGAEGWEIATSYLNPSGVPVHTFKRQKR